MLCFAAISWQLATVTSSMPDGVRANKEMVVQEHCSVAIVLVFAVLKALLLCLLPMQPPTQLRSSMVLSGQSGSWARAGRATFTVRTDMAGVQQCWQQC
jgi:hypothetical protein